MRLRCLVLIAATLATPALLRAQDSVEGPLPQLRRAESQAPPENSTPPTQQAPAHNGILTNAAVVKMTKAGLADDIILQTVRSQPGDYTTGPDDLVALKDAGVSQPVIAAMLARNSGLQQRPAPTAVEVTALSPNTDDPGVYFKNRQGQWTLVEPEMVHYRDGGALKSVLTHDIVKKDLNGEVNGPKSPLHVPLGTQMLILTPTNSTDGIEYVILRFHDKTDRREFRVKTGNVFHSETGSDRDALEIPIHRVSSRIYGFTVPNDLAKGEYGVLAPGSASAPGIAHAGKIYTFSISE